MTATSRSTDLQDLIDVVESVTGSLHMEKGRDNFDAEIRVLVANKGLAWQPVLVAG